MYNLRLDQNGHMACNDSVASVQMLNSDGTSFIHQLSEDDVELALDEDASYTYTVSIDTSGADKAIVTWKDPWAKEDKREEADGWKGTPDDTPDRCKVNVVDFCLDSASPASDGKWNFDFTIRLQSGKKCQSVSANLELIYDEKEYLGRIPIEYDTIVSAFECDCDKTISVQMDFDGRPGDIYGQLELRN